VSGSSTLSMTYTDDPQASTGPARMLALEHPAATVPLLSINGIASVRSVSTESPKSELEETWYARTPPTVSSLRIPVSLPCGRGALGALLVRTSASPIRGPQLRGGHLRGGIRDDGAGRGLTSWPAGPPPWC